MSEISDRYRRMADDFTTKVASVPKGGWEKPSPCEEWTARDVVRHVVDSHGLFLGFVGRALGDIPSVDEDPRGAFDTAHRIVQEDLDDPERASSEYDGLFGHTTFEESVGRFLVGDLLVHGWDLARATGLDEHMDQAEVARFTELAPSFGEAMRGPQTFGPALEPPPGADEQTKFLAFLGRRSWE